MSLFTTGSGKGQHICDDCICKAPVRTGLKQFLHEGFKFEQVQYNHEHQVEKHNHRMLFAVCFMQVWYDSRRSTVKISTVSASSPTPLMLDHEEIVRDLKKALQRAHVRNKNVKKQLVRSQQSQQRATDIIVSLRKDSDTTKKRLASILLCKRAETRLKNVYKQKYI